MAEENIQGPSGPHSTLQAMQANMNRFEHAEGESQEGEDFGIISAPGTAPALEDEPAE